MPAAAAVPVSAWVSEPVQVRAPARGPVPVRVRVRAPGPVPGMALGLKTAEVRRTIRHRNRRARPLTTEAPAFHREGAYAAPFLNPLGRSLQFLLTWFVHHRELQNLRRAGANFSPRAGKFSDRPSGRPHARSLRCDVADRIRPVVASRHRPANFCCVSRQELQPAGSIRQRRRAGLSANPDKPALQLNAPARNP